MARAVSGLRLSGPLRNGIGILLQAVCYILRITIIYYKLL